MAKFRKKVEVVDAVRWTGLASEGDVLALIDGLVELPLPPDHPLDGTLVLKTLRQEKMRLGYGDWIIRDEENRLLSSSHELFERLYEPIQKHRSSE